MAMCARLLAAYHCDVAGLQDMRSFNRVVQLALPSGEVQLVHYGDLFRLLVGAVILMPASTALALSAHACYQTSLLVLE